MDDIAFAFTPTMRRVERFSNNGEVSMVGVLTIFLWLAVSLRLWMELAKAKAQNSGPDRGDKWNKAAIVLIIATGVIATVFLAGRIGVVVLLQRSERISVIKQPDEWFIRNPYQYTDGQKIATISIIKAQWIVSFPKVLRCNFLKRIKLVYTSRVALVLALWMAKLSFACIFLSSSSWLPRLSRWFLYFTSVITVLGFCLSMFAIGFGLFYEVNPWDMTASDWDEIVCV
jgi:hypothetical protein